MSAPQPAGSVLVKCNPSLGGTKQDLILVTIPVDDSLITITELKDKVAKKATGLLRLSEGGPVTSVRFDLSWQHTVCDPERELEYYMPLQQPVVFKADILCRMQQQQERTFPIIIKPPAGRRMCFDVTAHSLAANLKSKIQGRQGVSPDQQRLVYQGKQLVDSRALHTYNITEGSELQLIYRLLGGKISSVRFADISNSSNLQKLPWARFAPNWLIAEPGLCIEGRCTEHECPANGRTVVHNRGMGLFDLIVDAGKITCPICQSHVEPETCAFNNCQWRYSGTKASSASRVFRSLDWTLAEDQYERFSSQAASQVDWNRLLISTRLPQRETAIAECAICMAAVTGSRSDPDMTTTCRHRYHVSCMEAYRKMGKSSCPLCKRGL
ncbi:MAG: hypothetical protein WDW38_006797 [Sanguina aurantia]